MNKKLVENVERSRKETQEGELYDWAEFKKIVDGNDIRNHSRIEWNYRTKRDTVLPNTPTYE
ncbi:hypothetical protein CW713_11995 [Methanophagales archaeon]|nr:MAG: hypothetical protein CW714_00790 [Methanophagales archaeon]RJS75626.1 MAG: hypothetical protein CW713_11995 [Methanophagales archaeon]